MTKEQLIAMGIAEDMATKVAEASADELKGYIPKAKYDEIQQALTEQKNVTAQRDTQLEDLKKSGNAELNAKINELIADNRSKDDEHKKQMQELRVNTALKLALTGSAHDTDLVVGLLDKSKIELDESGNIKSGYKEQIESIQKEKAFLFIQDEPGKFSGVKPVDGKKQTPKSDDKAIEFAKSIAQDTGTKAANTAASYYFKE